MGATVAEKILARASNRERVTPGDHVVCDVDLAMTHDISLPGVMDRLDRMGVESVWDPNRVVCPMDHVAPSHSVDDANNKGRIREFVERLDVQHFYEVGSGISHNILPEQGHVRPGELIVGSDSHTTTLGAYGAAGTGVSYTDMAFVLATGHTWFRVPETLRFEVLGQFDERTSTKDLMLHLAGEFGTDVARYRAIEFVGPAVNALPLDDRATLSNMTVDLGGKFGFTPIDELVLEYVRQRTDEPFDPLRADEDATYRESHKIDASQLKPKVAEPHAVGNVVDVDETTDVALDQVFVGSCTNGTLRDLRTVAKMLAGRTIHPDVRLVVTPASREIYIEAANEGLLSIFADAGGLVTNPTCGACIGKGLGVLGDGEVCLATQNRNFRGRMGSNTAEIYLASPETAAASAITGHITDPEEV